MHVIFREAHSLEETETPVDLRQTAAELVVLSFSDSDLGAFAAGWHRAKGTLPTLRLANLVALRHPVSVDIYIEATLAHAKGILVRLIGGESYWSYGLAQVEAMARKHGIALAVLAGDGRIDDRLDAASTMPVSTLRRLASLCDAGGAVAAQAALAQLAIAARLYASPVVGEKAVPGFGWYEPDVGFVADPPMGTTPRVVVVFYRSHLTAADTAPIDALIRALARRGLTPAGLFVPSLKSPEAARWVRVALAAFAPACVINATAFSALGEDGTSPLDAPGCPVFQIALSTARKRDWLASERGLSPADLAMHVALPEVDGRIFTGVASFKSPGVRDPDLQYSRFAHRPANDRIDAISARVAAWVHLGAAPAGERQIAIVLSTYPGRADQMAHAVGLDALASVERMLADLAGHGYAVGNTDTIGEALQSGTLTWPLADYQAAFANLPQALRDAVTAEWGEPDEDRSMRDGALHFQATRRGAFLIALQPERGDATQREAAYHDLSHVPCHGYIAFYLWLRAQKIHALVHVGAHGTLEWLPGKSVALSATCWPEALIGALPVIYPFIVNDPGEAAHAKRRIGAVTLGHLPPRQIASSVPPGLVRLERLLDEFASADGLDPSRRGRLIGAIRAEAQSVGVDQDLGIADDMPAHEAIVRIDRLVCDIKATQFGDGLHIYGDGPGERDGLLAALAGRRVPPGPAGSPWRGRADVLPTGRNLYSIDPRAVPSRIAYAQGVRLAEEVLRRHLQDNGDWPRNVVVDLWGSATMRTAGEDFAMALVLAGLAPRWDAASDRVCGFEIVPLAQLARPRIDVTLRVSGLFRDIFPGLAQLFEAGAAALATSSGAPEDNPYRVRLSRVFGPRPGTYGVAAGEALVDYSDAGRTVAGAAWLAASEWAIDASGVSHRDRSALEARMLAADGFIHAQDLAETDLLLSSDYASHEAGFAAAVARLGGAIPALYHLDASILSAPRARTLGEEIARVVRARAANPAWASGMMRHGFRGAAEIAATLDNLGAFAHLTRAVPGHLFDLYHEATLGRPDVVAFMQSANPAALAALRDRFAALREAGLWVSRRNSIAMGLEAAHD